MYKVLSCPQCGHRLCRAEAGSKLIITCPKCKAEYESLVDKDGGVHAFPIKTSA